MNKCLNNFHVQLIASVVKEMQVEAYLIGGYVRDALLNRESKDIDVVVLGSGIALANEVAKKLGQKANLSVFKNFGTAMVKTGDTEIEFVGARKESYRKDSRKPIVENGSLEDDQNRRDFTINALAISLAEKNYGQLIDPFDGKTDLDRKVIRTPLEPGITFSDDPLRMMRAVRFATQLNFTIEEKTFAGICDHVSRIAIVSKERITDEMNKILMSTQPSIGFNYLDKTGLLKEIFPELASLKGVDVKEGKRHKDNFYHTLEVLDKLSKKSDNIWLRWAALMHDIAKPQTKKFHPELGWTFHGHEFIGMKMVPDIFRRMKLPLNEKMKYVQKMVGLHLRPIALVENHVSDSAVRRLLFDAGDDIEDLMILCEADITSKNERTVKRHLHNFALVREKLKQIEEKDAVRNFQPPISGELIMEAFDIGPCKEVGMIKNTIKEAILDGEIKNDRDEAYWLMLKIGRELGLKAKEG